LELSFIQKIKEDAQRIIKGELKLHELSPEEERGRIEGGRRNVEASLILSGSENPGRTAELPTFQEKLLKEYAIHEGIWFDYREKPFEDIFGDQLDRGSEAIVYYDGSGFVIKAIDNYYSSGPNDALIRISLHNKEFPADKLEVIGFGLNEKDQFVNIVRQQFVVGKEKASTQEIKAELERRGYRHLKRNDYINEDYCLEDMSSDNVIITDQGNFRFIDTRLSLRET
jgi:hypothetical protein